MLDHYHAIIDNSNQNHQKINQKVLNYIQKYEKKIHIFRYLIKYAGKGVKGNLKRFHIINEHDSISKTVIGKENIEKELIEFNEKHFKKDY